jgi:glycerol-3-phosphate dehydrogenase (NAD(P)+)
LSLGLGLPCETDITLEGVKTAEAVTRLAADLGLDMPICKTVHDISGGEYSVAEAIQYLLNRPLKEE